MNLNAPMHMQPTQIQPMQTRKLNVDGVGLAIKRFGCGAPVVCLSAVGHDAGDFELLAARLGHKYEFICIEWPGHGESDRDRVPASAARYADLVEAALWELSIRMPIVIGNSVGGAAAILYAARRPVRALVLCDSGGLVAVDATVARICNAFARFFAAGARGAWWYPPLFALYYRLVLSAPASLEQRRRIVASARKIAPALADAWRSFGRQEADIRSVVAKLSIPVWFAWAKRDRIIPLQRCRAAIDAVPGATLDTFDASHTSFLEQPDQFAVKFEAFVARLPKAKLATAA